MADLGNIALTIEASQAAADLKTSLGVADQMALIKAGFAYAVARHEPLDRGSDFGTRGGSNYQSGALDSDGLMARTVELFYLNDEVDGEPYRAIETLMNKGLMLLRQAVKDGTIGSLSDLVAVAGT